MRAANSAVTPVAPNEAGPAFRDVDPERDLRGMSSDLYLREAWPDWRRSPWGREGAPIHRFGLLMMKPDGVVARKTRPALDFLEAHGFLVHNVEAVALDRCSIRALWFDDWVDYSTDRLHYADLLYTAADAIVVLVEDLSAGTASCSERMTDLKGPAVLAKRSAGHLRTVLDSRDRVINYVHASDTSRQFLRELGILLDQPGRARFLNRRSPAEIAVAVAAIEGSNPSHDFDGGRALQSLPRLRAWLDSTRSGGDTVPYAILLEAWAGSPRSSEAWAFIDAAKDLIALDVAREGDP